VRSPSLQRELSAYEWTYSQVITEDVRPSGVSFNRDDYWISIAGTYTAGLHSIVAGIVGLDVVLVYSERLWVLIWDVHTYILFAVT